MTTTANLRRARTVSAILAAAAATSFSLTALAQDVKQVPAKGPEVKAPQDVKQAEQPTPAVTAEPPLRFDSLKHDWGRVTDAEVLNHEFKFTNITDQTITIQNVTATCGCTVPQLQKKVYAPGESGEIKVQFNPSNRRGPQAKQVTVTFADTGYAPMRLDLQSNVMPMLWVEPNRVLFQDIYKGTGATQQVVVTARNPSFEISSMEGMEQHFSAKILKTEDAQDEGDPVKKITLEVSLDKAAPIGTYNTQLIFKSNEPKWPEFKIFATAMVVGELKADPPSAIIRTQQPNTPFETMAIIETRNAVPFEITDVEWTVDGGHDLNLVVDWEDYASTRGRPTYLLRISGVTPAITGQVRATITVKTNLEGDEQIPVVVWGSVRGANPPGGVPVNAVGPDGKPTITPIAPSPTNIAPNSIAPTIAPQKPGSK